MNLVTHNVYISDICFIEASKTYLEAVGKPKWSPNKKEKGKEDSKTYKSYNMLLLVFVKVDWGRNITVLNIKD